MKELSEQVFELESQLKDEEQKNTIGRQEWHKKEQHLERELQQLRESNKDLTANNAKLHKKFETELMAKNQAQE